MKYYTSIIIVIGMLLASCGNDKSKAEEEAEVITDQIEVNDDFEEASDCSEFVDQYEEWVDDYLELMERYKANPMDATLSQEYMEVAMQASQWSTQWSSGELMHCASKEKYQKRFDAISEKVDKKMEELGFDE